MTKDYTITDTDLGALRGLIAVQNIVGPSMPELNSNSTVLFFNAIDGLSGNLPGLKNSIFQGWCNDLYTRLINQDSGYGNHKFPVLYHAYKFGVCWYGIKNDGRDGDCDCYKDVAFAWEPYRRYTLLPKSFDSDCMGGAQGPWPQPKAPMTGMIN